MMFLLLPNTAQSIRVTFRKEEKNPCIKGNQMFLLGMKVQNLQVQLGKKVAKLGS